MQLRDAIQSLEAAVSGSSDRISIVVETDEDESVFVGTTDAFIRLATELLRTVEKSGSAEASGLGKGLTVRWSTNTRRVFDSSRQICIGAECILDSEQDRSEAVRYLEGT